MCIYNLKWNNEVLDQHLLHPSFPSAKTHKELKEMLFLDLIKDFTEGQVRHLLLFFFKQNNKRKTNNTLL